MAFGKKRRKGPQPSPKSSSSYSIPKETGFASKMANVKMVPFVRCSGVEQGSYYTAMPDQTKSASNAQVQGSYVTASVENLDNFVIIEPATLIRTDYQTLKQSAEFSHMSFECDFTQVGSAHRCCVKIGGKVVADSAKVSKGSARDTAASQALEHLRQFCWSIRIKADGPHRVINKNEILRELSEKSGTEGIASDNVGYQMLRRMGWEGGGMGKDSCGIAEPVTLNSVLRRKGFGSAILPEAFINKLKEIIKSYAFSDVDEDLVFSVGFDPDERKIIHLSCNSLSLVSKSKGKGVNRFTTVSKKRKMDGLFDYLMSVGGETPRYLLMPPGSDAPKPLQPPTQPLPQPSSQSISQPTSFPQTLSQQLTQDTPQQYPQAASQQFGPDESQFPQSASQSFPPQSPSELFRQSPSPSMSSCSTNYETVPPQPYDYYQTSRSDTQVEPYSISMETEATCSKCQETEGIVMSLRYRCTFLESRVKDLTEKLDEAKKNVFKMKRTLAAQEVVVKNDGTKTEEVIEETDEQSTDALMPSTLLSCDEDDDSIDIDSMRDDYESTTEWLLRRRFLQSNIDDLPLDRLTCLSRCFVNMAVYQCSYPPSVMQDVRERSNGVLEEIERNRKEDGKL